MPGVVWHNNATKEHCKNAAQIEQLGNKIIIRENKNKTKQCKNGNWIFTNIFRHVSY